jgi:hypothetical protein
VVDAETASEPFIANSFGFGGPSFLAGRHQGFIFEFHDRADSEWHDGL